MKRNSFIFIFLLLSCPVLAQTSLNDVNRGTFSPHTIISAGDQNKRPASTMDANGRYVGKLVPVAVDGQIIWVPENKALVISNSVSVPTEEPAQVKYPASVTSGSSFRDTPNPAIRNWPRKFLGVDKIEDVLDGRGITVAIFDSGVNPHEQFSQGNVDLFNVTTSKDDGDDFGHGTPVAGIIAGSGAGDSGFKSVAPGVKLKSFKIADKDGLTNNIYIAKAVDGVLAYNAARPESKITIINISYGLGEDDDYLRAALQKAYDSGIATVSSAGIGSNGITYPAAYDFVIAVAGVNHRGQFISASGRGEEVDFAAPGSGIFAPDNNGAYGWVKGTSFSAAYITGVAALASQAYLNKYGQKPSPAKLYEILAKISSPLTGIDPALCAKGVPDASKILSSI